MCEILCMSTLSRQEIKSNNDFNAMYVNTVDMQEKKYAKLDYTGREQLIRTRLIRSST